MPDAVVIPLQAGRRRTGRRPSKAPPRGLALTEAAGSWKLALLARDRSAGTIVSYENTVKVFSSWLGQRDQCLCASHDPSTSERPNCPAGQGEQTTDIPGVEGVETNHVRLFLIHERLRTSPGNAHKQFRGLRAYFRWLCKQGDRTTPSPVDGDDAPSVPIKEFPPHTDDEIRALLAVCKGNDFESLRDFAIILTLVDIGPRVEGLSGIRYTPDNKATHDLQLGQYRVRITLKGGEEYWAPLGLKVAAVIDRYIRRGRAHHPWADDSDHLWLGRKGRLTKTGIQQMLKRRGAEAGVFDVHPHRFRRTSATAFIDAGGSETDAMHIYGWRSPSMPRRYTEATARERARQAHKRLSPGDRF